MIAKIKKIIPYLLLLIALVGVLGYGKNVGAQEAPKGTCTAIDAAAKPGTPPIITPNVIFLECNTLLKPSTPGSTVSWLQNGTTTPTTSTVPDTKGVLEQPSPVQAAWTCNANPSTWASGCVLSFFNIFLVVIPSGLLYVVTLFFNAILNIIIQSEMYDDPFISGAWTVVRDLSNIFFILILLYVAIKTVLNMGGHETKSMIANVIIMAILINFSLFFTRIVIDSSNILAQIFYNKLDVTFENKAGEKVERINSGSGKDVAGAMYEKFDTRKLITPDFANQLQTISYGNESSTGLGGTIVRVGVRAGLAAATYGLSELTVYNGKTVAVGPLLSIMVVSGSILLVASYAFFTSGIYLTGRLIELWILMIFAPFAFMSFAIPKLADTEYIGWHSWSKKLISTAFVAPIFMFMLYLIFTIIDSGLFKSFENAGKTTITQMLLSVTLPGIIIIGLLLKAKDLAKKGSGQFGEMVMSTAKLAGVLTAGTAALAVAVPARVGLGLGSALASRNAGKYDKDMEKWRAGGAGIAAPVKPFAYGVGKSINDAQEKVTHVEHARHDIDELDKGTNREGKSELQLSAGDLEAREKAYLKKHKSEIDVDIKRGYDSSNKPMPPINANGVIASGESDYKSKRKDAIEAGIRSNPGNINPATGELNDRGKAELARLASADKLSKEFNEILKSMSAQIGVDRYREVQAHANEKIGLSTKALAKAPGATYNPLNLVNVKSADRRDDLLSKMATGALIAAVAVGIRGGMKGLAGINLGTSKGNYFGDLGEMFKEALKHVKITLPSSGGGDHGGEKKDDHGGGHGGGH